MIEHAYAALSRDLVAVEREVYFFDAMLLGARAELGLGVCGAAAEQDEVGFLHVSSDSPLLASSSRCRLGLRFLRGGNWFFRRRRGFLRSRCRWSFRLR